MFENSIIVSSDDVQEIVVDAMAFRGRMPSSDFASYLLGATRKVANGNGPLAHRTGVILCTPDCGDKIMIEIALSKPIQATMSVEVLGVALTLFKNFQLFPYLREGERITLRTRKRGVITDMHARGQVKRAPEPLQQVMGALRCALSTQFG